MRDHADFWDGLWAIFSLVFGEVTAALTVAPALYDLAPMSRFVLCAGFGLLLAATFFIMGLPLITGARCLITGIQNGIRKFSSKRSKES